MQVEYIRSIVLPVVSPSIHEKSIENNSRNVLREKNLRLQYLDACIQSDNGIGGKRPYLEGIMPIRPPVKWHGGKRYLASRIIGHFPQHRVYLEPFGGGASVLLNKAPVDVETYNDLDKRITRLFRVLREHGSTFVEQARFVLYSQIEFEDAGQYPPNATELQMAICDFIRWRQSFGGKGKSWSYTTGRARGGMAGDVNAWWTAIEMLPEIIERLRRVQIICQPATEAIKRFDHKEGLIYCDPPYVHGTRSKGGTDVYGVEMTDDDHQQLAKTLSKCKAKVVLSGYPSSLYDRLYKGWRTVDFDIANHAAGGRSKARATERLWLNF
jgi:DNA adenine methylase